MSTRSAIIRKTDYGYEGIYCHFDGYPSGVGQVLLDHYQDAEKVKALITLGAISSLGERVVAYHRDRGEEASEPYRGATIEGVASHIGHNGYVYVFDGGWTCNGRPLAEAIAAEESA